MDCVKRYTDSCFTENQRKEFIKAIEAPVEQVHQMCTSPDYQNGKNSFYLKKKPSPYNSFDGISVKSKSATPQIIYIFLNFHSITIHSNFLGKIENLLFDKTIYLMD